MPLRQFDFLLTGGGRANERAATPGVRGSGFPGLAGSVLDESMTDVYVYFIKLVMLSPSCGLRLF